MPKIPRRWIIVATGLAPAFLWLSACSATGLVRPYPKSVIDMAVSLAVGTVRTPEFLVVHDDLYSIMVQTDGALLPGERMMCMMGIFSGPEALKLHKCTSDDPLLRADWIVRDLDQVVARGSCPPDGHSMFSNVDVIRVIGYFKGQVGKKYTLEVNFTKDASALDAANPHLIVVLRKYR